MPHSHGHLHHRRDIIAEVGDFIDGINPFKDEDQPGSKNQRDNNDDKATLVKTIYKTMEPTFKGKVAGYTTIRRDDSPQPTNAPGKPDSSPTKEQQQVTPVVKIQAASETRGVGSTKSSNPGKSTSIPTAIRGPNQMSSLDTVLAKATGQAAPSLANDVTSDSPLSQTQTQASITPTSSSSSADSSVESGTSAGAKAGIAFGVVGGIFLVGMLVFFLFNRRRRQSKERQMLDDDDEKYNAANANRNSFQTMSDPRAPRISLRPVTQFLPNWNMDKRTSKGAAMALTPAGAANRGIGASAWERPGTSQSTYSNNPFGNQAERVPSPTMENYDAQSPISPNSLTPGKALPMAPDQNLASGNAPPSSVAPVAAGVVAGAAVGAAVTAASTLSRKTSMRKDGPNRLDLTLPPPNVLSPVSPTGTEFSMTSVSPGAAPSASNGAAAIAASGGPPNSSVHRVQLDFKPTLEDEMGLNAGDLVRLLHEYDDGWALCIRLDRSQQGVVPRTCLSTRPVKPRPQGSPRSGPPVIPQSQPRGPGYTTHPGQRPMTPQGMPMNGRMGPGSRPASPAGRPTGPYGQPQTLMGRSMSPGPRAQSPGPRYQGPPTGRPQSPSGMNRRMSPPTNPSPMNPAHSPDQAPPAAPMGRKPVPGQAY